MSLLEFDLCHSCWPYDLFSFRHWREDRIVGTFFTLIYMCTYRVINLFKDNNCSCNTEKLFHLLVYIFILLHVPPLTSYIGNSKEPSFLAPLYPLCHPLFIAENHKVYFSSRLWGAKQIIFSRLIRAVYWCSFWLVKIPGNQKIWYQSKLIRGIAC